MGQAILFGRSGSVSEKVYQMVYSLSEGNANFTADRDYDMLIVISLVGATNKQASNSLTISGECITQFNDTVIADGNSSKLCYAVLTDVKKGLKITSSGQWGPQQRIIGYYRP